MKINVQYMAQLKHSAGTASETVELPDDADLAGLLNALSQQHGDPLRSLLLSNGGCIQPAMLIFVNDQQARQDDAIALRDNDTITLLSPIAGG